MLIAKKQKWQRNNLDTLNEAKQYLLRLLTRREHTRLELMRKLSAKGYELSVSEQAINYVLEKGWLNEKRFIESYIQMRKRKGYGPLRIQAELKERGLSGDFLQDFSPEENEESLIDVFQKKFGSNHLSSDFALRAKQIRFLQYRGFSLEQIMNILDSKQ